MDGEYLVFLLSHFLPPDNAPSLFCHNSSADTLIFTYREI